jgi:hypothetical protein
MDRVILPSLKMLIHANALELGETTYKLSSKTGKWQKIGHRFVPY